VRAVVNTNNWVFANSVCTCSDTVSCRGQ
jgi:hypothetical protein